MELPPPNLRGFADTLSETVQALIDAWNDSGATELEDEVSPELIQSALQQLVEVLQRHEWQTAPTQETTSDADPIDVTELGEYGLTMLYELFGMAQELKMDTTCARLEDLALCLGLWVAGQDGELSSIDLLVNGIARVANRTNSSLELERLFYIMGDLLDAIPPPPTQEAAAQQATPRKLLLLNRAIVATRSLSPDLIEQAFTDVAEQLPMEASGFFREGMEQIKIQNYPDPVREVIERFYLDCSQSKTLH